jgi:hypothetical protein
MDNDVTELLSMIRETIRAWESAGHGSREEHEAAEKMTGLFALFDAALSDGGRYPDQWESATGRIMAIAALMTENEKLKAEGVPGRMHEVDRMFYDLTVKERDFARQQVLYYQGELLRRMAAPQSAGQEFRKDDGPVELCMDRDLEKVMATLAGKMPHVQPGQRIRTTDTGREFAWAEGSGWLERNLRPPGWTGLARQMTDAGWTHISAMGRAVWIGPMGTALPAGTEMQLWVRAQQVGDLFVQVAEQLPDGEPPLWEPEGTPE